MRALIIAAMLVAASPAFAQSEGKSPGEQIDAVLQDVLDAIGLVLRAVPQYELPEVLPNGDIIIRRVQPEPPPAPPPADKPQNDDNGVKT